jgi:hypothetical protein
MLEPSLKLDKIEFIAKKYKLSFSARSRFLTNEASWSQCFLHIFQFGFTKSQMVQLQGVSRIFYKRVAEWMALMTVYRYIKVRKSKVVCLNPEGTEEITFPNEIMVDGWCGIPLILVGFLNDKKDGTG